MSETRNAIVEAAAVILQEGSGAQPSVRAVAARAGVGASTLRHYFPTQRALIQAALTSVYEKAMPDERIRDTSVPAKQRLIECLNNLLAPVSTAEQAREVWRGLFGVFVDPEPTSATRAAYTVVLREARLRVESWLAVLEEEGALPAGDNVRRARYLLAIADGISIARAMPDGGLGGADEVILLEAAVDTVVERPWPLPPEPTSRSESPSS